MNIQTPQKSKDAYAQFLGDRPFLPIYIQTWYLDLVCGSANWNVCIVQKGGIPVAALPYCVKQNLFFKWIGMPPLSKLHGPYIDEKYDNNRHRHSIVRNLLSQLPNISFYQQTLSYQFGNWLPYLWENYSQVTLYSYVFKNIDSGRILADMEPDYRRRIKRAEHTLSFSKDIAIGDFYEVILQTYHRQHLSAPMSYDFIEKYYQELQLRSAAQIFCVRNQNKQLLAVAMLVWDKSSAYYLLEGTDPASENKDAAIYMKWMTICYTSEVLKLGRFDFEGSISQRIEKVYREMGAEAVPYYVIKKYNSKIFWLIKFLQNYRQYGKLAQW